MEICSRLVLLVLAWIFSITDVMTVNKVAGISRTCFKTLQRTKALPSFDDDDLRNTTERLDRFLSCQIPVRISCCFFFHIISSFYLSIWSSFNFLRARFWPFTKAYTNLQNALANTRNTRRTLFVVRVYHDCCCLLLVSCVTFCFANACLLITIQQKISP